MMRFRKMFPVMAAGALALAVGLGLFAVRSVQAAAPSLAAEPTVALHGGSDSLGGEIGPELAAALGITEAELTTAYSEAKTAALAEAVSEGLITQAQADAMTSASGEQPFRGGSSRWLSSSGIDLNAHLATALGISVEELTAARLEAYNARIDQAVADGEITQEQADLMKGKQALYSSSPFQTAMRSAFEAAVQVGVSSGVITQEQADAILADSAGQSFGGPGRSGDFGFGGGRGGHGGGRGSGGLGRGAGDAGSVDSGAAGETATPPAAQATPTP